MVESQASTICGVGPMNIVGALLLDCFTTRGQVAATSKLVWACGITLARRIPEDIVHIVYIE